MSKKIRVAINGAGRIGRAFFRIAETRDDVEIVALNDLGNIENLAYLLKYDSVYGPSGLDIKVFADKTKLVVNDREVVYLSIKEPVSLPWKDLNVDVAVESTGLFTTYEKSKVHLDAGAKKVVISAPEKGGDGSVKGETILL